MADLATVEDVEAFIGRDLTPDEESRVGAILTKLSELFRREARQHFTPDISTVRLKVQSGRVRLRQSPVIDVAGVTDDRGHNLPFRRDGQWLYVSYIGFVTVMYEHGSVEVPELVKLTIADAARQVLGISKDAQQGVAQAGATAGPYSEQRTYATWAQGGSARLSPEDLAIARSYRVYVPGAHSSRPGAWPADGNYVR